MSDELNKIEEKIKKKQAEMKMLNDKRKKALQRKRAIEEKKKQERIWFMGRIVADALQSRFPDRMTMEMEDEELKAMVEKIINSYKEDLTYGFGRE